MRIKTLLLSLAAMAIAACAHVEKTPDVRVPVGKLSPQEKKFVGRWEEKGPDGKVDTVTFRYPDRTFFEFTKADWYCGGQHGPYYTMGQWGFDGKIYTSRVLISRGYPRDGRTGADACSALLMKLDQIVFTHYDVEVIEDKNGNVSAKMPARFERIFQQTPAALQEKRRYYEKMILGDLP